MANHNQPVPNLAPAQHDTRKLATSYLMVRLAPFICVLSIAACSTAPRTTDVQTACVPMVTYSLSDQQEFAREERQLDAKTYKQVIRFLGDYKASRDAVRACQGVKTP